MKIEANLLAGVLALDLDFIVQEQLVEALEIWASKKRIQLLDRLLERGFISADDKSLLEEIARRKLERHQGNARTCLGATASKASRQAIRRLNDPEVVQVLEEIERTGKESSKESDPGLPPSRFRRIKVLNDEGGLGRIWLARDADLKRDVAMKVIKPERALDPDSQRRMVAEARITGHLEHPNIVPVYEYGHLPEKHEPFYVMKLLKGRTLGQEIDRHHAGKAEGHESENSNPHASGGRLNQRKDALGRRRLLEIFISVCNAVAFAHSKSVIHRDIKPANVMIGEFGEVILLDWGLAKVVDVAEPPDDSRMNHEFIGSVAWGAPEQAEGRVESINKMTDIYGLGATLFHILTGSPPHDGGSSRELIEKIKAEPTPRTNAIAPNVPPRLDYICAMAMSKAQEDRHPNALDLARDVRDWLDDEPVAAYRAAVNYYEKRLKENPHVRHDREGLASNRINLGLVLAGMDRHENAVVSFQTAIDVYRQLIEDYPSVAKYRADRASCSIHLHNSLAAIGSNVLANQALRAAKDDYEILIKGNPASPVYRHGWESVLISHNMTPEEVERRFGPGIEPEEAVDHEPENDDSAATRFYREQVENQAREVSSNPLDLGGREALARSLVKLGIVEAGLHRHLEAIANFWLATQHYDELSAVMPDAVRYIAARASVQSYLEESHLALNQIEDSRDAAIQASVGFGYLALAKSYVRASMTGANALRLNLLSPGQLMSALIESSETPGRSLEDVLLSRGVLKENELDLELLAIESKSSGTIENPPKQHDSLENPDETGREQATHETANLANSSRTTDSLLAIQSIADYDPYATLAPGTYAQDLERINGGILDNRYRKIREVAQGGLSNLYLARDEILNREVVLKSIRPDYAGGASSQSRFLLEAEITGGLQHPGIIPSTTWATMLTANFSTSCLS